MKNIYKLISLFLTVLMLLGTFSVLFTTNVFAADETEEGDDEQITVEIEEIADYTTQLFATPEEKLATMKLFLTKGDYPTAAPDGWRSIPPHRLPPYQSGTWAAERYRCRRQRWS